MTTARERMLELSPLPSGATAREHFLAITTGGGSGGTILMDVGDLVFEPEGDLLLTADDEFEMALDDDITMDADDAIVVDGDDTLEVDCE